MVFKGCAESGTIIGLESVPAKNPEDYKMALLGHLMELRKIPTFKRSEFVFIIENNLAFEAHHIVRFIQSSNFNNYVIFSPKKGNIGVITTATTKEVGWFFSATA